jgi:hypothetical protein
MLLHYPLLQLCAVTYSRKSKIDGSRVRYNYDACFTGRTSEDVIHWFVN